MGILDDVRAMAEHVARLLTHSGYTANFSPASVWEVERFFDEQVVNGQARPDGLLNAQLGQRMFALGSYLGEVIRRNIGGTWIVDGSDPDAEVNLALRLGDGSVIWPMQRVVKRFRNGGEDSLTFYAQSVGVPIGPPPLPPRATR